MSTFLNITSGEEASALQTSPPLSDSSCSLTGSANQPLVLGILVTGLNEHNEGGILIIRAHGGDFLQVT